jgi:hypothetical protein
MLSQFIIFTNSDKVKQFQNKYNVVHIEEAIYNKLFLKNIAQKYLCNEELYTIEDIHEIY